MDFDCFMAVFSEMVEKKVDDPRRKVTWLIKFVTGDAKEMAKNYIQLPAEIRFETAKQFLTDISGDPCKIMAACRKEIKHWPQIKFGDVDAYQEFQNFLVKLENIGHLQSWQVLDIPDIMCILLSELSGSARDKWSINGLAYT